MPKNTNSTVSDPQPDRVADGSGDSLTRVADESETRETDTPFESELQPEPAPLLPAAGITPRLLINSISVESVLYGAILILAFVMRFLALGERPLAGHEADGALAAFQFFQGLGGGSAGSPLLFTANLFAFFLGASTDLTPRLLPALVGSLGVLLPVLFRREIGRGAALIASVLLLLSTSFLYFARDAGGTEISVIAGLAAFAWLWRYLEFRRPRSLNLSACAAAVALTADSAGYTILIAGVLTLLTSARALLSQRQDEEAMNQGESRAVAHHARSDARNALILFAVVYAGLATALLVNREGLGAALGLLGNWLVQFSRLGPFTSPVGLLLLYEPLVLVFGLAGLILVPSFRSENPSERGLIHFIALLAVFGLAVYSLAGIKNPADMVVAVVPLAILAAWFITHLFERIREGLSEDGGLRMFWLGELPLLLIALVFTIYIYLQLATYLTRNTFSSVLQPLFQRISAGQAAGSFEQALFLIVVLVFVVSVLFILMALGSIGGARTANLSAVILAIVLGLAGVRALWLANFSSFDTVHEPIAADQTPLQVRDLASELEWQSMWRESDWHVIHGEADPSLGPVVRWYLRAFPNLQWNRSPVLPADVRAVVSGDNPQPPSAGWIDQRFVTGMSWSPENLDRQQLFQWLLFRQGGGEQWQAVRLWVQQPQ